MDLPAENYLLDWELSNGKKASAGIRSAWQRIICRGKSGHAVKGPMRQERNGISP